MCRLKMVVCTAVGFGLAAFPALRVAGQSDEPAVGAGAPGSENPGVVKGQPFSATKYSRRVRILPDGKLQFLRNEHYPGKVARDAEGRVRIEFVDQPQRECDQPAMLVPPLCPVWGIIVLDPITATITHWSEGENAAHVAVVIFPAAAPVAEAEDATSDLPEESGMPTEDGAEVTTQNLGNKVIDGISASGARTTSVIPAGHFGNKYPITKVHEIWTSAEMRLVVKVIDGDPNGEETISGLDHVSFAPDAALFRPPEGYEIQVRNEPEFLGRFFEEDSYQLAEWFVK
jgi:hypothetical protein